MRKFEDPTEETISIVKRIRKKFYAQFVDAKIITIMRNGKWSKYGTIRAVSDEQKKTGVKADYVLTLSNAAWPNFTDKQKRALVHHELEHMVKKETKKGIVYRCRHHDIEEFTNIVEIYGDWLPSVARFHKALEKGKKVK